MLSYGAPHWTAIDETVFEDDDEDNAMARR
jgi:hypothetical protein